MIDTAQTGEQQYSLGKVLGIWGAATAPMGLLAWVVWPALRQQTSMHPGILFWLLMIVGMVWQSILALLILRRELGTLRWSVLAPRIWAQQPRDPRTGAPRPRLWLMLPVVAIVFAALTALAELVGAATESWGLVAPAGTDLADLADPMFAGQWWLIAVALISCAFNYVLGEELLFRGVLLPRMTGLFGRWAWLANAVLFSLYHVHRFWAVPGILLTSLPFSWAAARYRTIWFAIILHGIEGVVLLTMVIAVVAGASA